MNNTTQNEQYYTYILYSTCSWILVQKCHLERKLCFYLQLAILMKHKIQKNWKYKNYKIEKKQAIVIFFNKLEGNSKANKSSTLSYFDLHNTDDGMLLFKEHDKAFQSETVDKAYSTYSLFISWQRTDNMNISPLSANPTKWSDTLKQFEFVWPLCGIGAHRDRTRIDLT